MSDSFNQGHALVVGVGADLPNTINDANGLAHILQDQGRSAYLQSQVAVLTGPKATRDSILTELDKLTHLADPQATVIIYFSGHGYKVPAATGQVYYLLPYGYDLHQLDKTAIRGDEFTEQLHAIKPKKLLLLLDCCHAGRFGDVEAKAPGLALTKYPLPPEAQKLFTAGSGRVMIASSRADELSFIGKPYSAFTLALIEALCGQGASVQDGYVRAADLALYTSQMVPKRTKNKQHPILDFQKADNFVLAYYAGGATQAKGLPFDGEPEIEPELGAWKVDQYGQIVQGWQMNVDRLKITGGFFQPGMVVDGTVNQAGRDLYISHHDTHVSKALAQIFDGLLEQIKTLAPEDQSEIQPIIINARAQAEKIQHGDTSPETEDSLEKRLRRLHQDWPHIAAASLALLAYPGSGVVSAIQKIAQKVQSS